MHMHKICRFAHTVICTKLQSAGCRLQSKPPQILTTYCPLFSTNVLPMFRMQYFCNNVRFATPICNTFLLNKDIWSRIKLLYSLLLFRTIFSPYKECPWVCHASFKALLMLMNLKTNLTRKSWKFLKMSFTEESQQMST